MPGIYLVVLFAPMFVILFWGIELLIGSFKKEATKQTLAFFMLCGFIAIISGIAFFLKQYQFYNTTYIITVFFALSQFPSFYIYIHSLTREKSFSYKIYIHYLYPFMAFSVAVYIHWIWFTPDENIKFVTEYLTGNPINEYKQNIAFITDKVYKYTFILFGIFYYWLVNKRVKVHREKMNNYFSNTEKVNLNWINIFNILFLLTLLSGIFYHGFKREFFLKHPAYLAIPYGMQALFYWVIGHFGSKQHEIYRNKSIIETKDPIKQTAQSLPYEFKNALIRIMQSEKPYLNHDLSLPDLAILTGTNRSYLSKFINETFHQNFKQFINEYRLNEAEILLRSNNNMDILTISIQCGFSSYHTFNRCFKDKFGTTPGEFRKQI